MTYYPPSEFVWSGLLGEAQRPSIDVYEQEPPEPLRPLLLDASGNWLPRVAPKPATRPRIGFLPWGLEETLP